MSGHWYTQEGQPMHSVPLASGRGERPTTLRDARKHNLIPSVTTVLGIFGKPGLETWKQRELLKLAYANNPFAGEDVNAYIGRIMSDQKQSGESIMGFGTAVHDAIEARLRGVEEERWIVGIDGETYNAATFVNPVMEMFTDNGWAPQSMEEVLVGDGYAGRADVIYHGKDEYGIIDFKTCGDATKAEKDLVRHGYPEQIALYHVAEHGGIGDKAVGYNIFISRDKNVGAVKAVRYDAERLREALKEGQRAVKSWQYQNNYTPEQGESNAH